MKFLAKIFGAKGADTLRISITVKTKWTGHMEIKPKVDQDRKLIRIGRPVPKDIVISSPFGPRKINGKAEVHRGYDFKAPIGTPVVGCADGAVFRAGYQDDIDHSVGFGLRIWQEIELEGQRFYLYYAHLSKIIVGEGDRIHKGQEIGLSGNTGRSTGPHLHIECRKKNTDERYQIEFEDA